MINVIRDEQDHQL